MPDPASIDRDRRRAVIEDLVIRCIEAEEAGQRVDVDEVCSDHPEVAGQVRAALDRVRGLEETHARSASLDPLIGELVAHRYRLDGRLGSGAMGAVYRATDLELGRTVALKLMLGAILDRETALARFDREATALAAVDHPSVVTIHDRGVTEDGAPFLVMELVEGVPCIDLLERARERADAGHTDWLLDEFGIEGLEERSLVRQSLRWGQQIADGLAAAHAAGLHHRDVKPSNVMIGRDGRAILIDFGIAIRDEDERLTRSDGMIGTPAYLAPEALTAAGGPLEQRDVYGLAATLYHLLTLESPYRGSTGEVLAAIATREPVRAEQVRPGLPQEAQAVLDMGLARDWRHRYPSMRALERDLAGVLAYRPIVARPIGPIRRSLRAIRRSRAARWAAAAALVTALAFIGYEVRSARLEDAARERGVDFRTTYESVPTNIGVSAASARRIDSVELDAEIQDVLDRLVETGVEPTTALALRATYSFDQGRLGPAVRDVRAIDAELGTAFSAALLAAYEGSVEDGSALDLDALPPPSTDDGRYLLALHLIRASRHPEAAPLIDGIERAAGLRHAVELGLIFEAAAIQRLDGPENADEREIRAERLLEDVTRFESESGCVSGITRNVRALAHAALGQWSKCLEVCEGAIADLPDSPPSYTSGARAAYLIGRLHRAEELARAGLNRAPEHRALWKTLTEILISAGRYAEARRELAGFQHLERSSALARSRAVMVARANLEEALDLLVSEAEPERLTELVEAGRAALARLDERDVDRATWGALADALDQREVDAVVLWLWAQLVANPTSRSLLYRLVELSERLPGDEPWIPLMHRWIRELRSELLVGIRPGAGG